MSSKGSSQPLPSDTAPVPRPDPEVRTLTFVTETSGTGFDLLAEIRRRGLFDDAEWASILHHRGILLDGFRVNPESPRRLVQPGSHVAVYLFVTEPALVELPPDAVLFDRDGVVGVNKPAWLTVQGSRASRFFSLERTLRERLARPKLACVHRLDRETSGLVLFAENGRTASHLGRQFQDRSVEKEYLAVVAPPIRRARWSVGVMVREPARAHSRFGLRDRPCDGGRPSCTHFEAVAEAGGRSLVVARPVTGRTHQIRVHLEASGSPIVGDGLYGAGRTEGARHGEPVRASRLQLHAHALAFDVPSGERLRLEAPAPDDFGLDAT